MGRIDGKVAIVTGGSSGVGAATAIMFAKEGAKVVVADCDSKGGEKTVSTIKAAGGEATFVKTDVSKVADVQRMIKTAVDTYGKLDVLFNNAGILLELAPTVEQKEENFEKELAVNLKGVFYGMKYAIPEMLKGGGGSIINTASGNADIPLCGLSTYNATKGGVVALSRTTAMEYRKKNIRVNYINPMIVVTAQTAVFGEVLDKLAPMGRRSRPEEIAAAAVFLASDESSYVTATGIVVDGGCTAYSPITLLEV